MKKVLLFGLIIALSYNAFATDKYISKSGHIWFYSKTPLEKIEAHNNQVATVIDTKTGAIAFDLLMRAFKFEKALMEEHFNENYVESAKYPKCIFKGKITDFDYNNFNKNGSYNVTVEGDMTMHGVTKYVKEPGTIEVRDGKIYAKTKFNIKPEDYNITIPGLVRDKIANTMQTTVEIVYEPFNKQ